MATNKGKVRRRKPGGKGKRRRLRGQALVQAAQAVLIRWSKLSPESHPINVSRLANKLGVTRQAIYGNKLIEKVGEYKAIQKKNFSPRGEGMSRRRTPAERLSLMQKENEDLKRIIDGWVERWAAVEYNTRMLGIDADKIFAPVPPPHRK